MNDKQKIDRLAKAMGMEVIHGNLAKEDGDSGFLIIINDWNPWENPDDLRPVLRFVQNKDVMVEVETQIELNGIPTCCYFDALLDAVFSPNIIADAALSVLEDKV